LAVNLAETWHSWQSWATELSPGNFRKKSRKFSNAGISGPPRRRPRWGRTRSGSTRLKLKRRASARLTLSHRVSETPPNTAARIPPESDHCLTLYQSASVVTRQAQYVSDSLKRPTLATRHTREHGDARQMNHARWIPESASTGARAPGFGAVRS